MAKSILPRVHVLVICDEIEERWEGDPVHDLLGVRTQLTTPMFPHVCPQLCVFVQVTGHQGRWNYRVDVVRAENDEVIVTSSEEAIHFTGPTDFMHLRFRLFDCTFPSAGVYYIQLFFDGRQCAERAFEVLESEGDSDGGVA